MNDWIDLTIGDFSTVTSSKRIFLSDYVDCGIQFWRSKEVIEQYEGKEISNSLYISQSQYELIEKKYGVPKAGDILITSVGTIGIPYLVKNGDVFYFKDGNLTWIKNINSNVSSYYLYKWITSPLGRETINSYLIGSSQKALTIDALKKVKVKLPPLPIQQKIAAILSAYDDLIENNLKQIKLLEEMAQITYEEWFVRFKFPNHENTPVDEVTGLPLGWERKKLGDFSVVGRGSSPRPISDEAYFVNGTIPWLKIADATSSFIFINETKQHVNDYGASFSRKLPKGSLIVAASGTLGFPMILGIEACIHDGWMYFLNIPDNFKEYFYYSLIYLRDYFAAISYGAAIQNINTEIVKNSPLLVPDKNTLDMFHKKTDSIFTLINQIQMKNQLLKEARDILLPRLMTGKISVDNL